MKTYNIISHINKLEAQLVVYRSGNGTIRLDRPIRRFYHLADRLEHFFPMQVVSASIDEDNKGILFFVPLRDNLVKELLTRFDKILDEIG